MTGKELAQTGAGLPKPSKTWTPEFEKAVATLAIQDRITAATNLLPRPTALEIAAMIDREPTTTDPATANEFARRLIACYPDLKPADPQRYVVSLAKVFASYPESLGRRVVDPAWGLPSKLSYSPKVADLTKALEAEMSRRRIIRANALWHVQEGERRAAKAHRDAEWERNRPDMEQRRRTVDELLATLKPQTLPGEDD